MQFDSTRLAFDKCKITFSIFSNKKQKTFYCIKKHAYYSVFPPNFNLHEKLYLFKYIKNIHIKTFL